jgi:hypothetical protein
MAAAARAYMADKGAILFLIGTGEIVSTGESTADALATAIATTVLSRGTTSVGSWIKSSLDTYAALVDADSGEILWVNSQKSKGFSVTGKEYIAEQWPSKVLDGLPSRPDQNNP